MKNKYIVTLQLIGLHLIIMGIVIILAIAVLS